jgi:hypothetical protein
LVNEASETRYECQNRDTGAGKAGISRQGTP